MTTRLKAFDAVPAYFGGKQKLARRIIKQAEGATTFIDAFSGGGVVSLAAKAQGFKVISNDYSRRSFTVLRALIENDSRKITREDIYSLLQETETDGFVSSNYVPDYFTERHGRIIDIMRANLALVEDETLKALLTVLLIKYIFYIRPFSAFGQKNLYQKIKAGDFEKLSKTEGRYLEERAFLPCVPAIMEVAEKVNSGVFPNGQANEINNLDVFEFLGRVSGDVVYIDPPYVGSTSYEKQYEKLDSILEGRKVEVKNSVFNQPDALGFIERLFDAAVHIPKWIISFGGPQVPAEEILRRIGERREKVTRVNIGRYYYSFAGEQSGKKLATEFLIVAE